MIPLQAMPSFSLLQEVRNRVGLHIPTETAQNWAGRYNLSVFTVCNFKEISNSSIPAVKRVVLLSVSLHQQLLSEVYWRMRLGTFLWDSSENHSWWSFWATISVKASTAAISGLLHLLNATFLNFSNDLFMSFYLSLLGISTRCPESLRRKENWTLIL